MTATLILDIWQLFIRQRIAIFLILESPIKDPEAAEMPDRLRDTDYWLRCDDQDRE